MSARNFWLVAFFWLLLLGGLVTCASVCGGSGGGSVGSGAGATAAPDVDLEAVLAEYKRHVKSGAQDLAAFEKAINERKLYKGSEPVACAFDKTGAVVGFVDGDADRRYVAGTDKLVFKIEADKKSSHLIASDRHHRRYRIGLGEIAGLYLISSMFNRHRGYYRTWRPSRRSGSSSIFGGTRSRSRSSWGSGGGGGWGGGGK